jgi:hypothetical protein
MRATVTPNDARGGSVSIARLSTCASDVANECDLSPVAGEAVSIEEVVSSTQAIPFLISANHASAAGLVLDLEITFNQMGDNFTCRNGNSTPILQSGVQQVDTVAATNTFALAADCGSEFAGEGAGPDRFFALSLGRGQRAALELSGPDNGLLWATTSCDPTATCTAAASISSMVPARIVLSPHVATNFVIAVDGVNPADAATYTLKTVLEPECVSTADCRSPLRCDEYACVPVPANDACPGTMVAASGGTFSGSTEAANDDFATGNCEGIGSLGAGVPDVVYAITLPAGLTTLHARITQATFQPVLSIRQYVCGAVTSEKACNFDGVAGVDVLPDVSYSPAAAGTYYIIVDGISDAGTFTLEIDAH